MAGGWSSIVDENGAYENAEMLENGGDVEEFARHAYGMVWYLASTLGLRSKILAEDWVADAARNHRMGFSASPTPKED